MMVLNLHLAESAFACSASAFALFSAQAATTIIAPAAIGITTTVLTPVAGVTTTNAQAFFVELGFCQGIVKNSLNHHGCDQQAYNIKKFKHQTHLVSKFCLDCDAWMISMVSTLSIISCACHWNDSFCSDYITTVMSLN